MGKKCPPYCSCGKHKRRSSDGGLFVAIFALVFAILTFAFVGTWRLIETVFDPHASKLTRWGSGLGLGGISLAAYLLLFVDYTPMYLDWAWGKRGPDMVASGRLSVNYLDAETKPFKVIVTFKGKNGLALKSFENRLSKVPDHDEYTFAVKTRFDRRIQNATLKVFDSTGQEIEYSTRSTESRK